MPTLPVNDVYSKFHSFCNFIDRINPINTQCFHVKKKSLLRKALIYDVGEEIVHQKAAHVEKGVIEKITTSPITNALQYHIKFKDNGLIVSGADSIRAP